MGELAKKDNPQPIQPIGSGELSSPSSSQPVETRRIEHVIIPPPGGMGAPQTVPIPSQPPPAPGAPASQTVIYINVAPPHAAAAQPAVPPPQPAPVPAQIVHHHVTEDQSFRLPRRRDKALSIAGLIGLLLGIAAIYLRFKPVANINPLHVAIAGAVVAALGLLSAILGGQTRAGLPFLALILCGAHLAIDYGWDKPAIDQINEQLKKHNINATVPQIPQIAVPAPAPRASPPGTTPATQSKPAEPALSAPTVPPVLSPPASVVPSTVPAAVPPRPAPADATSQAREMVAAARRDLDQAKVRALADNAEYQQAKAALEEAKKALEAARDSDTGTAEAARKEMSARNRASRLEATIFATDPRIGSSEQALRDAERKLAAIESHGGS